MLYKLSACYERGHDVPRKDTAFYSEEEILAIAMRWNLRLLREPNGFWLTAWPEKETGTIAFSDHFTIAD